MGYVESSNFPDVAFTCICDEPEGQVLRSVKLLRFTPDNLRLLWSKVSKFRTFMGKEINTMEDMLGMFITDSGEPKGLCMMIDDMVGLFYLTEIHGTFEASVHYTFFDRRHRGRVELCKKALEYAFRAFDFQRLSTTVPEYEVKVGHFVQQNLGFVYTGRQRKNKMIRGKLYDTLLYDILREEFLNGNQRCELQNGNSNSIKSSEPAQV